MNKYVFLLFSPLYFLLNSCTKDFLDRSPSYYSDEQNAYNSIPAIKSALAGCYDGLQDYRYYGRNFYCLTEAFSDNAKLSTTNNTNFLSFYNHSVTKYESELQGLWEIGYKIIARTNNVINAINSISTGIDAEKKQILGEALALRSLVYFDLVRIFAQTYSVSTAVDNANGVGAHNGIPIVTEKTSNDSIQFPHRNSVNQVYTLIISNLLSADTLLSNTSATPYTFSSLAVKALLARVYLSIDDWINAKVYSNLVMASARYSLVPNQEYIEEWSDEYSSESIFSIPMSLTDNCGTNSIGYMLSKEGYGDLVTSNDLYTLYDDNDIRKSFFRKGKDIYYLKYPGRMNVLGIDNIPVIRYSEMYFIRAEALTRLSLSNPSVKVLIQNISRSLLDTIRKRVNPKSIPLKVEDEELISLILQEKRKEFPFEGMRYFELKRNKESFTRKDGNSSSSSLSYPNYMWAFPIPASEVNSNRNIIQNQGY